jgi:hypothetical protein
MTKQTSVFARFLVVVAVLALSVTAVAQIQFGQITGTVVDQQGAAISGATVKVTSLGTGVPTTAITGDTGLFVAKELVPGGYKITVEKQGFKTASQASFTVNAGVIHRVDFKLTVGERTEVVEVVGTAPLVNTEDSKLASTVSSQQIANLPLNGRNVFDLMQIQPGAVNVHGVDFENGHDTVVNGLRENFSGFLINGVSDKGLSGGTQSTPIQDTVQEFQQLTLNNSSQYGNSAGSIVNLVTKSGTNNWHGSAWWFIRNDNLDATPFFIKHTGEDVQLKATTGEGKPELRFNQFGGTLGGPIVKDKLFFFASYQGDRFLTSQGATSTIESPQWRTAVAAAAVPGFPGQVAGLLYSSFAPTVPGTPSLSLNAWAISNQGPNGNDVVGDLGGGVADMGFYLCPATYAGLPGDPTGMLHASAMANIIGVILPGTVDYSTPEGSCAAPLGARVGTFGSRANNFENTIFGIAKVQASGNLFHGNEASMRVDWIPREQDRIFGQFNWVTTTDAFGAVSQSLARNFLNPTTGKFPHASFNWVHTFNPHIVNEVRAGYVLGGSGAAEVITVSTPGVPFILFDTGETGFGSYNGYPQTFHENIYSYADMLSITKGKHNLKIGYDLRRNLENSEFNVGRPSYYFTDPLTFSVDAPYEVHAGTDPCQANAAAAHCAAGSHLSTNVRHWRNWEHGAYFQDDWKISRRLTLNLGIRYDLFTRHTEKDGLATIFLKGPGTNVIDNITTGAGWLANANVPGPTFTGFAGTAPCNTGAFSPAYFNSGLAGVCGPGGYAPTQQLGAGDHNNFGPRLGFAWDVFGNGKTSVRGGFGISYEGTLFNPLSNSRWDQPYFNFADIFQRFTNDGAGTSLQTALATGVAGSGIVAYGPQNPGCLPVSFTGAACPANNQGPGGASAVGNIQAWSPLNRNISFLTGVLTPEGIRDPYVYSFYLSVQHELPGKMVFEATYVGTAAHKLFRAEDINRIPGGRLRTTAGCVTDYLGRSVCGRRTSVTGANPLGVLNPNYGRIRNWQNSVNSNYNALQLALRKQTSHGLTFSANYTWSHSLDIGSTWHSGATTANGRAPGEGFAQDQTNPKLDYGNSIFDIRHRFVVNYIWEMPWFKNAKGAKGFLLSGWQWNGIWSFQTGAHWSPFCSSGGSCDFLKQNYTRNAARVNVLAQNFPASHDMWANGWANFDPAFALGGVGSGNFFSRPCSGRSSVAVVCVGNQRRNQFVGPNYFNGDISLFKTFKVTERVNLQFRAESFNVLNRTNFQLPANPNNRVNLSSIFGLAADTFNPRQLQFGLKLSF